MDARDGIFHPLRDVHGVVADALQIFGDHQQVYPIGALVTLRLNPRHQFAAHLQKQIVHLIVVNHHLMRQIQIFLDERLYAVGDHIDGGAGHIADMGSAFAAGNG